MTIEGVLRSRLVRRLDGEDTRTGYDAAIAVLPVDLRGVQPRAGRGVPIRERSWLAALDDFRN